MKHLAVPLIGNSIIIARIIPLADPRRIFHTSAHRRSHVVEPLEDWCNPIIG